MKLFLACACLIVPIAVSASIGFNETQLTTQPGHLEVGFGHFFIPLNYYMPINRDPYINHFFYNLYLADLWLRTGVTPGLDVGVSFAPLGARLDACLKHKLYKDYLSLSYELQSGLWTTTIGRDFALQISLLAGYPGKMFSPYGILRQRFFFLDTTGIEMGSSLLLVSGLRLKLKALFLYAEFGTSMGKFSPYPWGFEGFDIIGFPLLGAGASIDFDFKEIFAPLLKPRQQSTSPPDSATEPATLPPP